MTDPIFALPRTFYQSYADLYQLIALSGFSTCYLDEIDPASDNTYVMTVANGENQAGWQDPRADIYLLDLEWHLDGVHIPGVKAVLAGDKWYAEQIGARYTPLGSHPGLCPEVAPKQDLYDVAYIGYIIGVQRREQMRQRLIEAGVKVSPTGAWGAERHTLLRNSAAYLCVHQHDNVPTIAPLRMVVAAAYALPVISESVADAGIFKTRLIEADYEDFDDVTLMLTTRAWEYSLMKNGVTLHELLCEELTFRKSIEAAL